MMRLTPILTSGGTNFSTQRIAQYSQAALATDSSPTTAEPIYTYTLRNEDLHDYTGANLVALLVSTNAYSTSGTQTIHFLYNGVSIKSESADTTSTQVHNARIPINVNNGVGTFTIAFVGNQICNFITATIDGVYVS